MPAPFVQEVIAGTTTTGGTLTLTLPGGVSCAVGNTVLVASGGLSTASCSLSSISDSKGNTWTTDINTASASTALAISRSTLTTALVPGDTITIAFTGGTLARVVAAASEWAGTLTPDKSVTAAGTSTSPASGNTATTTTADELLYGAISRNPGSTVPVDGDFTAGASYTKLTPGLSNSGSNNKGIWPEYRVVSATGAYSASGTIPNTAWRATLVTYSYTVVTSHPRSFAAVIG